jgi:hypothetical protein
MVSETELIHRKDFCYPSRFSFTEILRTSGLRDDAAAESAVILTALIQKSPPSALMKIRQS